MTELPSPLVSIEVDLRDFKFMPLDVLRLRDSDLACLVDAEVFRCAVLSWCVAWHQTPAASLPDDDALLARLLGFGRDVKGWKRVRSTGGMRGWVLCSDGRLYHPVVAEKARDAWSAKLAQRARTEAARKAREESRQKLSHGLLQKPARSVTDTVTESKGQGQGQGQGQGEREERAGAQPTPPKPKARTPKTPMPPDFTASAAVRAWAKSHGFERVDEHAEAFRCKCAKHAYAYADWDAALREAIREDWAHLRGNGNGGQAPPPEPKRTDGAEVQRIRDHDEAWRIRQTAEERAAASRALAMAKAAIRRSA